MAIKTSTYLAAGILTLCAAPLCMHFAGASASGQGEGFNLVKALHGGGGHHAPKPAAAPAETTTTPAPSSAAPAPAPTPAPPQAVAVPAALTTVQKPGEKAPAKSAAADLSGKWSLSIVSEQGNLDVALMLKQVGAKLSGTMSHPHGSGDLEITGEIKDGAVAFAADHAGEGEMHMKFTGKVLENGQLAGTLTSAMGEHEWKAARVK